LFDARAPAFAAVIVLQERAGLADGQTLVDFGLETAWHAGDGPTSNSRCKVPATNQQRGLVHGDSRQWLWQWWKRGDAMPKAIGTVQIHIAQGHARVFAAADGADSRIKRVARAEEVNHLERRLSALAEAD